IGPRFSAPLARPATNSALARQSHRPQRHPAAQFRNRSRTSFIEVGKFREMISPPRSQFSSGADAKQKQSRGKQQQSSSKAAVSQKLEHSSLTLLQDRDAMAKRNFIIAALAVVALLSAAVVHLAAQQDGTRFRISVDLVQLNVAVTDGKGNYITGL